MDLKTITYVKESGICVITLNRPKRMNALNDELLRDLDKVLDDIAGDNEIGAVIITGGEKFFCVGADIIEAEKLVSPVDAHGFETRVQRVFNKIWELEKPVIAAVSGPALGGGCELSLACDIRIVAENASFGQPEIKIGVIPGGGGTQRLPRLIGLGRAKELLYTGDAIDSQEAFRIGLANRVFPVDSLLDEAKKLAAVMVQRPALALKMTKMAVNQGINMDIHSALAHEARCFELLFSSEDQKEGMKAFIEKRRPIFKGR
jgi:enoyl-CoA hydratase